MRKPRAKKEPKKPVGITPEFEAMLNSAATEELKGNVVTIQKQLEEVNKILKGEDESPAAREISRLKRELSTVTGPALETKKALNNRTKYLLKTLGDRGQI
jgi:HPt (histidine-containing phosphotransfer) domain-containing protein